MAFTFTVTHANWPDELDVSLLDKENPDHRKYFVLAEDMNDIQDILSNSFDIHNNKYVIGIKNDLYIDGNVTIGSVSANKNIELYGDLNLHSDITGVTSVNLAGGGQYSVSL